MPDIQRKYVVMGIDHTEVVEYYGDHVVVIEHLVTSDDGEFMVYYNDNESPPQWATVESRESIH